MKLILMFILVAFSLNSFAQTAPIAPIEPMPSISVPESAAPPQWAQDLIVKVQSLPVIGPVITKIMVYAGILGSILTAFVAFILTALSALSGIAGIAGLDKIQAAVQAFKSGKIMYWITYLSMFNAKKPAVSVPAEGTLGKVS